MKNRDQLVLSLLIENCQEIEDALARFGITNFEEFNKDSVISIPFLNITYRNNCDSDYYLVKVSPRSNETNMVLCWPPFYEDADYYKRAKENLRRHNNKIFNVIIGNLPFYNAGWMVFSDTVDYREQGFSFESIGCSLQEVYDYIYPHSKRNEHLDFSKFGVTPEDILGFARNHFAFLKSGESYTDKYNLIGFKLVEGCFTFIINWNTFENYVVTIDDGIEELKLPSVVGEYRLYTGAFNTNNVTVCFGNK